jgi:hypothetical protein
VLMLSKLSVKAAFVIACRVFSGGQVKQATVDKLHETYYAEVARLFQKHKEGFPGYDDVRLAFANN